MDEFAALGATGTSMKAPPKRKGNTGLHNLHKGYTTYLNESPSEKEGKSIASRSVAVMCSTSMKAPPKRKGNLERLRGLCETFTDLNESPSEKEGKFFTFNGYRAQKKDLNESPSEKEGK